MKKIDYLWLAAIVLFCALYIVGICYAVDQAHSRPR